MVCSRLRPYASQKPVNPPRKVGWFPPCHPGATLQGLAKIRRVESKAKGCVVKWQK